MSENLSRRGMLSLGSFASGLLLPFAGGKALSIIDRKEAHSVGVAVKAYPTSSEIKAFWHTVDETENVEEDFVTNHRHRPITDYFAMREKHKARVADAADEVWQRPVLAWGDVAELAQIAWCFGSKEKAFSPRHTGDRPTGRLYRRDGYSRHLPPYRHLLSDHAANMLIEGVLTLTGGRRYDPYVAGYERQYGPFVSWNEV